MYLRACKCSQCAVRVKRRQFARELSSYILSFVFHSTKAPTGESREWLITSYVLFQVFGVLQRFPFQQCPLTAQEGSAWHSRAQHEASWEKNPETKSCHCFSTVENASALRELLQSPRCRVNYEKLASISQRMHVYGRGSTSNVYAVPYPHWLNKIFQLFT